MRSGNELLLNFPSRKSYSTLGDLSFSTAAPHVWIHFPFLSGEQPLLTILKVNLKPIILYNLLLSLRQELHFFSLSLQDNKYDLFQSFNSKQEVLSDSPSKRKVDHNQDLTVAKYYRFKHVYLVISHWVSRKAFLSILRP